METIETDAERQEEALVRAIQATFPHPHFGEPTFVHLRAIFSAGADFGRDVERRANARLMSDYITELRRGERLRERIEKNDHEEHKGKHGLTPWCWLCMEAWPCKVGGDTARRKAADTQAAALRALLDAIGDEACRLDHHGNCQTHFVSRPCVVAEARSALEAALGTGAVTERSEVLADGPTLSESEPAKEDR